MVLLPSDSRRCRLGLLHELGDEYSEVEHQILGPRCEYHQLRLKGKGSSMFKENENETKISNTFSSTQDQFVIFATEVAWPRKVHRHLG